MTDSTLTSLLTKPGGLYINIYDNRANCGGGLGEPGAPAERKPYHGFDPWNLIQVILAKESRFNSFFSCGFSCPTISPKPGQR
jgi:hypothetical protein